MNVDGVDFDRVARRHAPGDGRARDDRVQLFALQGGDGLGVADTRDVPQRIQDNGGRDHRPARQPRPTSSTPATWLNPMRRSVFSNVRNARPS
jgi:hypothetical protein